MDIYELAICIATLYGTEYAHMYLNFAITTQGLVKWPRPFAATYIPDHRETILSQASVGWAWLFMLFIIASRCHINHNSYR